MRTFLTLVLLGLPLSSHALQAADCPPKVTVSYVSLIPVSDAKIERLKRNPSPEVYQTAALAHAAVTEFAPEKLTDLAFKFSDDEGGVCRYRPEGGGEGRLEVFSKAGENSLRVYLPLRGYELFTDHVIARLSARTLKVDYRPTTDVMVKISAKAYQVGWAYSLSLD